MNDREIKWVAYEHKEVEHGPNWYWTIGALAIAIAAGAFILNNPLLAVLVIIATVALLLQTAKKPRRVTFAVDDNGVRIGRALYRYQDLDSFSLTEENILIKSKKKLMPFITIPLPESGHNDIYEFLLAYLNEDDHTEPAADRIMEELGF